MRRTPDLVMLNSMEVVVYLGLVMFGAALGSFAGAQTWRLRAHQLVQDKLSGEKVDAKEYKRLLPLTKRSISHDRSIDLDTGKQLPWYDMIPIVSWLVLRGKSRFSGKPIGWFEFVIEIALAAFFVLSYLLWPYDLTNGLQIARLVVWLLAGVGLAILFAYDAKWFLLPDGINYSVIGLGVVSAILSLVSKLWSLSALTSLFGSLLLLSGLYGVLYIYSKGKWVGLGDVKLGLGLALLLSDWKLAFVALFAANLIGTLLVLPGMLTKKLHRNSQIPFGPLLIAGTVLAQLLGGAIITWYMHTLL